MIYLLTGTNHYGLQKNLKNLTESFAAKYGTDGIERYDGEDVAINELPSLLQSVSLFTPKRMVILREASRNKGLWEVLGEWAGRVPSETVLVLVEPHPDKRTKTYKTLVKDATLQEAAELNESTAVSWLQSEAKTKGATLERKEAQLLVARIGTDQARLSRELDKLVVHPAITPELIVSITEATPQATAFELLDAVLNGQAEKAQDMITQLRGAEEPYKLFGLFSSQVYALAVLVAAGSKVQPQQVTKDTGVHSFVLGKLAKNARNTSWAEVQDITSQLADLDDKLKGSGVEAWSALEITLMRIASRAGNN